MGHSRRNVGGALASPDYFPKSQRKDLRISYCDGVSDHYDPRSFTTTRRFLGGLMAVSRALIIKSDHICHMLHSITTSRSRHELRYAA